ncbi:MAG: GNAT family N-acetyltransferase [Pseudomonadota bacterium]
MGNPGYDIRPLASETWEPYASLIERHNGVWGGCWCMMFHPSSTTGKGDEAAAARRAEKKALVDRGAAHAALVFSGESCIGWAQYGGCAELPQIQNRRAYEAGLDGDLPDWRITCFFTDKNHRRAGVSAAALAGAVDLIGAQGGGRVEAYPDDVAGRKTSAGFLCAGTLGLFEKAGFAKRRKIGKHRWVVDRAVG